MDLDWTPAEQQEIARVRELAVRELRRPVTDGPHDVAFDRAAWKACGAHGLLGLPIPPEHGGAGRGFLLTAKILETLGEHATDRGLLFAAAAHTFACVVLIWKHGSPEQQREWLPRLCSGEWIGANAITEADAGSDVYSTRTTAVRHDDHYVIDGVKSFVSNAPEADLFLVYATTNRELGALGLSAFVVRRNTPGVTIGRTIQTIGLRTTPIATVTFDG